MMKFDVILFAGETLADFDVDENSGIRLNDMTSEEAEQLYRMVSEHKGVFMCCLPFLED